MASPLPPPPPLNGWAIKRRIFFFNSLQKSKSIIYNLHIMNIESRFIFQVSLIFFLRFSCFNRNCFFISFYSSFTHNICYASIPNKKSIKRDYVNIFCGVKFIYLTWKTTNQEKKMTRPMISVEYYEIQIKSKTQITVINMESILARATSEVKTLYRFMLIQCSFDSLFCYFLLFFLVKRFYL